MKHTSESEYDRISELAGELAALDEAARRARFESLRAEGEDPEFLFSVQIELASIDNARREHAQALPDELQLLERIACGSMGTVYRARHAKFGEVAVKLVHDELIDDETIELFRTECALLQQLHDSQIPHVHQWHCSAKDKQAFLVMDLIKGVSITAWARDNRATIADRLGKFYRVCKAVEHAHDKGVLHLDLKPDNILVANTGHAFVVDFGLARSFHLSQPRDDGWLVAGTLDYMSPEQVTAAFGSITDRSDQYSLGLILFELVAGCLPYRVEGHSPESIRNSILNADIPQLGPEFGDLGEIVTRALRTDPAGRFPGVADLRSAVRRFLETNSACLQRVPPANPETPVVQTECPFRGLEPFEPEHAQFFFGRDQQVAELLAKIEASLQREGASRLLAILGTSGSGKSSLARAGLIAALRRGELPGSEDWPMVIIRPETAPLESLAVGVIKDVCQSQDVADVHSFVEELRTKEESLHLKIRLALHGESADRRALILVDQMEEVFTICESREERRAFIASLIHVATAAEGRAIVVVTLRNDFYANASASAQLAESLANQDFPLLPIRPDNLREVIEEPARMVGMEIEPALTELLMSEMQQNPEALPLLQFVLRQLWERRDGPRFTVGQYMQMGELTGAVKEAADAVFDRFTEEDQKVCRRVMLRLIHPGETGEHARRRVAIAEFQGDESSQRVLEELTKARLLTRSRDDENTVEVSHEALIRSWPKLQEWIEDDLESIQFHRRLTSDAEEWQRHDRKADYLLGGRRLAQAVSWVEERPQELNDLERSYLRESHNQQRRQRIKRYSGLGITLCIVTLLIIGVSVFYRGRRAANVAAKAVLADYIDLLEATDPLGHDSDANPNLETLMRFDQDPALQARAFDAHGRILQNNAKLDAARVAFERSLEARSEHFGPEASETAVSHRHLAELFVVAGELDAAAEHADRALDLFRRSHVADELERMRAQLTASRVKLEQHDLAAARMHCDQAYELCRTSSSFHELVVAECMEQLGSVLLAQGKLAFAESSLYQALYPVSNALGRRHPQVARIRLALAEKHLESGDTDLAEENLKEAQDIFQDQIPAIHPLVARVHQNLGRLHLLLNDSDLAASYLMSAQRLHEAIHSHPLKSRQAFPYQAQVAMARGYLATAERFQRQWRDTCRGNLGETHELSIESARQLGEIVFLAGREEEALDLLDKATRLELARLERIADKQSELEQWMEITSGSRTFDSYVSAGIAAGNDANELYGEVLNWKGSVSARQYRVRARMHAESRKQAQELSQLSSNLSNLAHQGRAEAPHIERVLDQRERIARTLSKGLVREDVTPLQVRSALPPDTVLLDFLEYRHLEAVPGGKAPTAERRLVVFVVSPMNEGAVKLIPLAKSEDIRRSIRQVMRSRGNFGADGSEQFRRLVWQPLEDHLGDAKHLLICPDGPIRGFPMAALKISEKQYFIEKFTCSRIVAAQLLPDLLRQEPVPRYSPLLLVGDPWFGREPEPSARVIRGIEGLSHQQDYRDLPSTRMELASIREFYQEHVQDDQLTILRHSDATKKMVLSKLGEASWVHIASHGLTFVGSKPEAAHDVRSLADLRPGQRHDCYHPALLSGLVLAGSDEAPSARPTFLTSLEISTLDLSHIDTFVVSACGSCSFLGELGDEMMGVGQALRIAGARTSITSLWRLDDARTVHLMQRFYENLWVRNLNKAEALRQAQIALLRDPPGTSSTERGGLTSEDARSDEWLPPFYWAGFVLTGDWR